MEDTIKTIENETLENTEAIAQAQAIQFQEQIDISENQLCVVKNLINCNKFI